MPLNNSYRPNDQSKLGYLGTHKLHVRSPHHIISPLQQEACIRAMTFQDIMVQNEYPNQLESKTKKFAENTWFYLEDKFGSVAYELKWVAYSEFDSMINELASPENQGEYSALRTVQRDGEKYEIILRKGLCQGLQLLFKGQNKKHAIPKTSFFSEEEVLLMKKKQALIRVQQSRKISSQETLTQKTQSPETLFQGTQNKCTQQEKEQAGNAASGIFQTLEKKFGSVAYQLVRTFCTEYPAMWEELVRLEIGNHSAQIVQRKVRKGSKTYMITLWRDEERGLQIQFKNKNRECVFSQRDLFPEEDSVYLQKKEESDRLKAKYSELKPSTHLSSASHIDSQDKSISQKKIQDSTSKVWKKLGKNKVDRSRYTCTKLAVTTEKRPTFEKQPSRKSGEMLTLRKDKALQLKPNGERDNLSFSGVTFSPKENSIALQEKEEIVQLQQENPLGYVKAMRTIELETEIAVLAGLYGAHEEDVDLASNIVAIHNLLNEKPTKAELQNPERNRLAKEFDHLKLELDEIELDEQECAIKETIEQYLDVLDILFNNSIQKRSHGFQAEAKIGQLFAETSPSRIIHHCLHTQEATSQPGHFIKEVGDPRDKDKGE